MTFKEKYTKIYRPLLIAYYYEALRLLYPRSGVDAQSDVIISMTTHPGRVVTTHLAVESLLRQRVKPNKIILYVSRTDFPKGNMDLTRRLLSQKKRGLEIVFLDVDHGPYDKLIHSYRKYRENRIVTVDDDLMLSLIHI